MNTPLSGLISATVRLCRRRGHDLLVSFADSTHGHHGGIYQAASWNYAGKRDKTVDGCIINGVFIAGRSCNSRWGTRSPVKLAVKLRTRVIPHYDEGKHLYWKPLNRKGREKARRLKIALSAVSETGQHRKGAQ